MLLHELIEHLEVMFLCLPVNRALSEKTTSGPRTVVNRFQCLENIPWVNDEKSYSLPDLVGVTADAGEATALLALLTATPLMTEDGPVGILESNS